jgi:hypothetical protein
MKNKNFLLTLLSILIGITSISAQQVKVDVNDFKVLIGKWQGTLTYLDYSSGKPYSMPANVEIKQLDKSNYFLLSNIYPDEMSANGLDTLVISLDGTMMGTETVKSKKQLENGNLEIITEELGKDGNDNKPALFKHTYTIGKTVFKKRKDVQFIGESIWINRHEFAYSIKVNQ